MERKTTKEALGLLRDFFECTDKAQDTSLSKEERQRYCDTAFEGAGTVQTLVSRTMGEALAYARCSLDNEGEKS
jgi:hypothetical protein